MTNAESETTGYQYDALGNRTFMTENDGVVTRYDYDPIYRLNGVTLNYLQPALPDHETNVSYGYSYDAAGNLLAISDPLQHITQFEYDSLNRRCRDQPAGQPVAVWLRPGGQPAGAAGRQRRPDRVQLLRRRPAAAHQLSRRQLCRIWLRRQPQPHADDSTASAQLAGPTTNWTA